MLSVLKRVKFYLKYFATNQVINRLPFHGVRLLWYRSAVGMKIGPNSQIWLGCRFYGNTIHQIEIGDHTVLAYDVEVNASAPVKIGDHVNIAAGVCVLTADHDLMGGAFAVQRSPVNIESFAWIATRAIILKGVTIGKGAVISAGSVVHQDVKPMAVVAGNPARPVGVREALPPAEGTGPRPLFC